MSSSAVTAAQLSPTTLSAARRPKEHIQHAFSFLSPQDLARASCVCKAWRGLASTKRLWQAFDLNKVVPGLTIIDERVWERYVDLDAFELDPKGAPPINKRQAIPFLINLSKQVENDAGITLLTMPKGLMLNKLLALGREPKRGRATRLPLDNSARALEIFGNNPVEKTHTIAITNAVLKDSRGKDVHAQLELIQRNKADALEILPVITLTFLTHMSSSVMQPATQLYIHDPLTDTRCQEQGDKLNIVIGNFAATLYFHISSSQDDDADPYIGAGAMCEL